MAPIALKLVFAICSVMLWRVLYVAILSGAQCWAARRHRRVAEFSCRVSGTASENGGRLVELATGNQLRRRPSSLLMKYPFAERRRA
jgi:hypothetical protein